MKMIGQKQFPYRGRLIRKGDEFDVADKTHARQLRGAGLASDLPPANPAKQKPTTPDTTTAAPNPATAAATARGDQTYDTRVLTARD